MVHGAAQRVVARVDEVAVHAVADVAEPDAVLRIGETERAAETGVPEGTRRTKRVFRPRLGEAEREARFHLQDRVAEASRWRNRRRHQLPERLLAQPEFLATGGEDAVGMGEGARGADAAAGRHFEVAPKA